VAKLGLNLRLPFGKQALTLAYKKKPHRDGWFILDMGLSLSLNKNTQFFTYITNLLNVEYQELEGIAQPGRSNELGMRIQW